MEWSREGLVAALKNDDAAQAACSEAVRAGAVFKVWSEPVSASDLARIYARRGRHLAQHNVRTVGFDHAVDQLLSVNDQVRIGSVQAEPLNFGLFVHLTDPVVIACVAVDAAVANPDPDSAWPTL